MRIVAGAWRGRGLIAPPGDTTRPTADRVRQALFDMLLHAPWGGRLDGLRVLDCFAGTGALALEALSRGAAFAIFIEQDRAALAALRANISSVGATDRCQVLAGNMLAIARQSAEAACGLVFLDPPYGQDLVACGLAAATTAALVSPGALVVAEVARDEPLELPGSLLAERSHGAARITVWRLGDV